MAKKKDEVIIDVVATKELVEVSKQGSVVPSNPQGDEGIDTTEMQDGIELKRNKLGKFISPEVEGISMEEINARIIGGKLNYILWGEEEYNAEHKGKVLLSTDNKAEAQDLLKALVSKGDYEDYTWQDVKEGYVILFEDIDTGAPHFIKLGKSGKKEFLNYTKAIRYKLLGNTNNALSKVKTVITSKEFKAGKFEWLGETFKFMSDITNM